MGFDYTSPPPRELLERYDVPEDVIDGVLGMHAHELAEKIRDGSHHLLIQRDGKFYSGMHTAADLIDPEVQ